MVVSYWISPRSVEKSAKKSKLSMIQKIQKNPKNNFPFIRLVVRVGHSKARKEIPRQCTPPDELQELETQSFGSSVSSFLQGIPTRVGFGSGL